jgi:hypothetical protein
MAFVIATANRVFCSVLRPLSISIRTKGIDGSPDLGGNWIAVAIAGQLRLN